MVYASSKKAPGGSDGAAGRFASLKRKDQSLISGKPSSLEVQWGQRTALMEISLWQ